MTSHKNYRIMKEWTIHIPVEGVIVVKICSETPDEALQIFTDKHEQLLEHPSGKLFPISHRLTMYTSDNSITN